MSLRGAEDDVAISTELIEIIRSLKDEIASVSLS